MTARRANPRLGLEILRATAAIVEEKGPDGVTMREVADRVGYSATTIYLYFKNKDELLDETVDRAFEWLSDHLERSAAGAASPLEALRASSHGYVRWGIQNPGLYRLMFEHAYFAPFEDTDAWDRKVHARRKPLRESRSLWAAAVEKGVLPAAGDVDLVTQMSWAALHGLTSLAISGRLMGPMQLLPEGALEARTGEMVDVYLDAWVALWGPR